MQFQFNVKVNTSTYIEFSNSTTIERVQKIIDFKKVNLTRDFTPKQFKYSFDNQTWSNYIFQEIATVF